MKNQLYLTLALLAAATGPASPSIHAEILRYTAGIDVNCPAGLGE